MRTDNSLRPNIWRGGFTLSELVIVVAIAGILTTIGVPSFRSLIQSQRISSTVNEFFAALYLARSEAILRGTRVDLVPTDSAGDWAKGWVVFIDKNANQKPDAGESVIFSHDAVGSGISIATNLTDSTVQYVAYQSTGRTRTNASSQTAQFGTFTFTLDKQVRKVKLNFLGRPRVCNPDIDSSGC